MPFHLFYRDDIYIYNDTIPSTGPTGCVLPSISSINSLCEYVCVCVCNAHSFEFSLHICIYSIFALNSSMFMSRMNLECVCVLACILFILLPSVWSAKRISHRYKALVFYSKWKCPLFLIYFVCSFQWLLFTFFNCFIFLFF